LLKLCFATNNQHKLAEVIAALGNTEAIRLTTLAEAGIFEELPETQDSIEGNARQKALHVFEHYAIDCFADDTGLEVEALNGAPGVDSAHYAGPQRSSSENIALLLRNLQGKTSRAARFRSVIWLVTRHGQWSFEGVLHGTILESTRGNDGFGYDPIFLPNGSTRTLAEMTMEEKNHISHRGIAIRKLVEFLRGQ